MTSDGCEICCRCAAREQFLNNIPEVLSILVGQQSARRGAMKVFETLQDPKLNKQLFYVSSALLFVTVFDSLVSTNYIAHGEPGVAQWLRHCATSWAVPGSNPGGVGHPDFFLWILTEPCALGSTQPQKMSIRDSPGGKGGRCIRLTTYHPCSAERQEIRDPNLPRPPWAILTACCGRDLI